MRDISMGTYLGENVVNEKEYLSAMPDYGDILEYEASGWKYTGEILPSR